MYCALVVSAKQQHFFNAGLGQAGQFKEGLAVAALGELNPVLVRVDERGEFAKLSRTVAELVVQKINGVGKGRCFGLRNLNGASARPRRLFEDDVFGKVAREFVGSDGDLLEQKVARRHGDPNRISIARHDVSVAESGPTKHEGVVGVGTEAKAPLTIGREALFAARVDNHDVGNPLHGQFFGDKPLKNYAFLAECQGAGEGEGKKENKIPHDAQTYNIRASLRRR